MKFSLFAAAIILFSGAAFFVLRPEKRPLPKHLISVDTTKITSWEIWPFSDSTRSYSVVKDNGSWKIRLPDGNFVTSDSSTVNRSLRHFEKLKPFTKVTDDKANWAELGVDKTGTLIKVFENGTLKSEFVIGKMFFIADNLAAYYVRLQNETTVYSTQLYLDGSIKAPISMFRNKSLLPFPTNSISSINVMTASGFRYILLRNDNGQMNWTIDNIPVNPVRMGSYLGAIQTSLLIEKFTEKPYAGAEYSMRVRSGEKEVTINASKSGDTTYTLVSSANSGNYKAIGKKELQMLFPDKIYFVAP